MFKLSDINEAQHWRSDGHKCYNNARKNMPNMSFGSFLLHFNVDERVSVPWIVINKTIIETALYFP